jgi:hypothetical protein
MLADGGYTYVVFAHQTFSRPGPAQGWVAGDPASSLVRREKEATILRINGELDPEGCDRKGAS